MIEQVLSENSSLRVKENALFVLSQSNSSRARDIIGTVAKGGNPDLQLKAIKYLGIMGGNDNRQILADVYRASSDSAVKRSIIRSFMVSGDRARLRTVELGHRTPFEVEILAGADEGAAVIRDLSDRIEDGARVRGATPSPGSSSQPPAKRR